MTWLETLADLASIITAGVAAYAYGSYRLALHGRQAAMENILANKKALNDDSLTLSELAAALTLTEDQVVEAASRSKKVESYGGQLGKEYRFRMIKKPN